MSIRHRDDPMKSHLIETDRKALQLRNTGHLKEAAELFATIVKEQPDWEHGTAFYNLACCYEKGSVNEIVISYVQQPLLVREKRQPTAGQMPPV